MMYVRLAALVALFNGNLMAALGRPFAILAAALVVGWAWTRLPTRTPALWRANFSRRIRWSCARLFAALFAAILVITRLALTYLGQAGVYTLAGLMGVTDVDPFIMSMTEAGGTTTSLSVAASAILIAAASNNLVKAASNNLVKGIYAYALSDRQTGLQSLGLLAILAAAGLAPLAWLER